MQNKIDEFVTKQDSTNQVIESSQALEDAIRALNALGYKPQEAKRAVQSIHQADLASEQLIRLALQQINKKGNHAERLIDAKSTTDDEQLELSIRPKILTSYGTTTRVLHIFIRSRKTTRGSTGSHSAIPPGLGKTTLAHIIANEMGSQS